MNENTLLEIKDLHIARDSGGMEVFVFFLM